MTRSLIVKRQFQAPKKLVYDAFTKAEHLIHWFGPKGFDIEILDLEVHPGGVLHYKMTSPDGYTGYGVFHYMEVEAPDRIVLISAWADDEGNIIRAPFNEKYPLKIENEYLFEEADGITTLTFTGIPIESTTAEFEAFENMLPNLEQGFGKTLDQFGEYLQSQI